MLFLCSCTKNDLEITGTLVHPNQTPVTSQGVHLKTDNIFGEGHKDLGEANTGGKGDFRIFAKSSRSGKYYIYATQGDGSLMKISDFFYAGKNKITDVGVIVVSWK